MLRKLLGALVVAVTLCACGQGGVPVDPNGGTNGTTGTAAPVTPGYITGTVSGATAGMTTVTMTPASGTPATAITGANGTYSFPLPAAGLYTIAPSNVNYGFSPQNSSISVTPSTPGLAGINFSATSSYSISGQVTGAVLLNVRVWLYNTGSGAPVSTFTDANGYFQFTGLPAGTYTVIPALSGYSFNPASNVVQLSNANVAGNNFSAIAGGTSTTTTATISGSVTGAVLSGVNIFVYNTNSAVPAQAVTDANGHYIVSGLTNGTYTVIPSLTGYSFSPANVSVPITGASVSGTNFVALAVGSPTATYMLSGMVTGAVVQNVKVVLYGPTGQLTATTDVNGYYQFTGLGAGSYTVVPTMAGYTFSPLNNVVTITNANIAGNNYVATAQVTNTLSGMVSGSVVQGVVMTLYSGAGTGTLTATTDVNGYYQFTGLANGSYTVVPTLTGAGFSPTSKAVSLNGAPSTGNNFSSVATLNNISGTVPGLPGATITLSGVTNGTTTTDLNGNYVFTALPYGQYTVTPSLAGYTFNPVNSTVTLNGVNVGGVNFAPAKIVIPTYTLSGNITNPKGLAGTTVTLSGTSSATTTTDALGNYQFTGLIAGSYTVTPSYPASTTIAFSPVAAAITLSANTTANFTGLYSFNFVIGTNTSNYDLSAALVAAGWDGKSQVTANLTVAPGVTVFATSTAVPAMSLPSLPTGSQINLTNNGNIIGCGGVGGVVNIAAGTGTAGAPGGTALSIAASTTSTTAITNNGMIAGGGGGGGFGAAVSVSGANVSVTGGNGGTGAGVGGGQAAGGPSAWPAGAGGALGAAGSPGYGVLNGVVQYATPVGAAGAATVGKANATWIAVGTITGPQN